MVKCNNIFYTHLKIQIIKAKQTAKLVIIMYKVSFKHVKASRPHNSLSTVCEPLLARSFLPFLGGVTDQ